ncbi:MAG: hypothetical protein KGS72_13710 [Cyanobacteria bacterium REEB67]|nr:hypothetical protein [Cyanobacteria bacterium REEB67]
MSKKIPSKKVGKRIIQDDNTYYAIAHNDFKLEDLCDGYIYQRSLADYEGCAVDPAFINTGNFEEVLKCLTPYPDFKKSIKCPADMLKDIEQTANIKMRFRNFK